MEAIISTLPIDFPHAWGVFGGSIFRDEYKANFAEAEEKIHKARECCDEFQEETIARLDLILAVHSILVGRIQKAEEILDRLRGADSGLSPEWRLRAENYRRLIIQNGSVLHAFDNSLDLPDSQTNLTKTFRHERLHRDVQLETHRTAQTDVEDEWILIDVWAIKLRTTAVKIPRTSPIHPCQETHLAQNRALVERMDGMLAGYSSGYPHRLRAEAAHVQGLDVDNALLDKARDVYAGTGDTIGQAACILLKGDWVVSQPFSNPTALNLVICESVSHNGTAHWDDLEDDFELRAIREASLFYDEAKVLFEQSNAKRGVAAVYLRKACLFTLGLLYEEKKERDVNFNRLLEAMDHLNQSKTLFETAGDHLAVQLVSVHKMILVMLAYPNTFNSAEAAEVGRWGASNGCFQYVHDLGILLLRLGNFVWRTKRSFDSSVACLKAAQNLFSALGAQGSEIQAEVARAEIFADLLDLSTARTLFLDAETKLNGLEDALSQVWRLGPWRAPLDCVKQGLHSAMATTSFYLGDRPTFSRLSGEIQASSADGLHLAREAQTTLYRYKAQYRNFLRQSQMAEAMNYLEKRLQGLSHIASQHPGSTTQITTTHAKAILQSIHEAIESSSNSWTESLRTWNPYFQAKMLMRQNRVMFWLCLLARNFDLAFVYKERLDDLEKKRPGQRKPDTLSKNPSSLLAVALLLEGRAMLRDALVCINIATCAVDTEWQQITDRDVRMLMFSHSETTEIFNCAIRICFRLNAVQQEIKPREINCDPPLTGSNWTDQAFIYAERGKARSMLEAIRSQKDIQPEAKKALSDIDRRLARVRKTMEQIAKLAKKEGKIREQIGESVDVLQRERQADSGKQLSKVQSERQNYERRLIEEQAALEQLKQSAIEKYPYPPALYARVDFAVGDIASYLTSIPENTAVVEFCTMSDGIGVFVIGREGILTANWADIHYIDLQKLVADFLFLMNVDRLKDESRGAVIRQSIEALSKTLIQPIEHAFRDKDSLIFVPSGCLFNFPFAVLEVKQKPLIFNYAIMQVPSLSIRAELHARERQPSNKGVVFGNLKSIKRLEYGIIEALALSQKLNDLCMADQMQADEFKAAAQSCDIIHVCAHGRFDHDAPLLSTIQLLQEKLNLIDLADVLGPAGLVVFSACFSGFGKVLGSNDAYGFPHAMLSLGVRAFIGSLWAASDAISLIVMWLFYQELLKMPIGTPVAHALQSAQLRLLQLSRSDLEETVDEITDMFGQAQSELSRMVMGRSWGKLCIGKLREQDLQELKDPFYWAAFVLVGDGFQTFILDTHADVGDVAN